MLKLVHRISQRNQQLIREDLENYKQYLKPDISRYAKGRQRFWFKAEWDLRHKKFRKAIQIERLDNYLQALGISYDLGMIAYGENGIHWHRDDSYANFVAYTINLSSKPFEWGYQPNYPGYQYSKQVDAKKQIYLLQPGDIIKFNCKNPHATLGKDPERWAISLWTVKPKLQEDLLRITDFEKFVKTNESDEF